MSTTTNNHRIPPPPPHQSATVKTAKSNDHGLAKRLEMERERFQLAQKRRRTVYEAICALIDPVSEREMLDQLPVLDLPGWAEVIEERFLGRLCGYPVCANTIQVDFRRKFTLNHRCERKEFLPTDAEANKFCSSRCMCFARSVALQLDTDGEQPMATTLPPSSPSQPPKKKQFQLPTGDQWRTFLDEHEQQDSTSSSFSISSGEQLTGKATRKCYLEAELVRNLADLKVAENAEGTGGREDEDGDQPASSDSEREEQQFLQKIKSFCTKSVPDVLIKRTEEGEREPEQASKGFQWKRGFLLKESEGRGGSLAKQRSGKGQRKQQEKLLGDIVERLNQKWTANREGEGGGDEGRKPKIVGNKMGTQRAPKLMEPERISADKVQERI